MLMIRDQLAHCDVFPLFRARLALKIPIVATQRRVNGDAFAFACRRASHAEIAAEVDAFLARGALTLVFALSPFQILPTLGTLEGELAILDRRTLELLVPLRLTLFHQATKVVA